MKRIYIIGESLPLKSDGQKRLAHKTNQLSDSLVPMDPRHGVFPNLVMKPLFATAYALHRNGHSAVGRFIESVEEILQDNSPRRLNVFEDRRTKPKKKKSEPKPPDQPEFFETSTERLNATLAGFDYEHDLWLVFGHQTNFGLLWWLVDNTAIRRVEKTDIVDFAKTFTNFICCASSTTFPNTDTGSGRVGLLHRLCVGVNNHVVLRRAIEKLNPKSNSADRITRILRSTIPLLHNEGYQDGSHPIGNAQAHFVRNAIAKPLTGDLYWQVMGNAISTRLTGAFVESNRGFNE